MDGASREREKLSLAVITVVADAKGVDPTDLDPPLATVIDVDALDALFDTRKDSRGRVSFQYSGYEVTVHDDGRVECHEAVRVHRETDD